MPEAKTYDDWRPMDWIILGSSGFWELGGFNSKQLVEKMKKVKLPEILSKTAKERNLKRKRRDDYE